jgi:hypothetical protein
MADSPRKSPVLGAVRSGFQKSPPIATIEIMTNETIHFNPTFILYFVLPLQKYK